MIMMDSTRWEKLTRAKSNLYNTSFTTSTHMQSQNSALENNTHIYRREDKLYSNVVV